VQAQARKAGPEFSREQREQCFSVSEEAAGPAGPRLTIEEVRFRFGSEEVEVSTTLALGRNQFRATVSARLGETEIWELAAAASVDAMQQYLQQQRLAPATPQVQMLNVAIHKTGLGEEYIVATVRVIDRSHRADLLGAALVRNDRSRTAVAAALDATSRYIGRFAGYSSSSKAVANPIWNEETLDLGRNESAKPAMISGESQQDIAEDDPEPCVAPSYAPVDAQRDYVPAGFPAIGVMLSPTTIFAAGVDSGGAILADARRAPRAGAEAQNVLDLAIEAVQDVMGAMSGTADIATSIGIAVGGMVDEESGLCVSSGDFPRWRDVELTNPLMQEFGIPTTVVGLTHASAFAEFSFGAAVGIADLLYIHVNRDIKVGFIAKGRPFASQQTSAEHAGHMIIEPDGPPCSCGGYGCWQSLAGREALVARVAQAARGGAPSAVAAAANGDLGAITPALVVRMANAGDSVARRALEETGRYFALGLANLVALLGSQAVIVESRPPSVGAALLRAAEAALKSGPRAGLLSRCVLLTPELGESSAVLGAAAWAARSAC